MNPGTVIILNGTSSSGKSSIVTALQKTLDDPYLDAGLDRFLWMLPGRYRDRPLWDDVLGQATKAGEIGDRLVFGMHRAIAELARAGNYVVADHVLIEPMWIVDLALTLGDLPTWLIGVLCPVEVLEKREKIRADRTLGQARAQYELVHRHAIYDLEVDTSAMTPEDCAEQIGLTIRSGFPTALGRIKQGIPASKQTHR